jgi:hypothetical protein
MSSLYDLLSSFGISRGAFENETNAVGSKLRCTRINFLTRGAVTHQKLKVVTEYNCMFLVIQNLRSGLPLCLRSKPPLVNLRYHLSLP